jgi:tetraacyldisaccharide 4'-kinase
MFGNELCIPAGPLRETISSGLLNIDAIILTGNNETIDYNHNIFIKEIPIFESVINLQKILEINQDKFLAFCGLGNPHKFYKTLEQNGFNLIQTKSFPDHYQYNDSDINNLRQEAKKYKLQLITTEKDYVKINEHNNTLINVASINITMEKKQLVKFKALIKESIDG